jgi:hypothetical protein
LHGSIYNEQIEPAVVVVIEEECAETCKPATRHPETCLTRAIFKDCVPNVHEKSVRLLHQVSDQDVVGTTVVKIGSIDSHSCFRFSIAVHSSTGQ